MNSNNTFTEKEFNTEIVRFRQLFGDKTWWNKTPEERQRCVDGLAFMYLSMVNNDGSLPEKNKINQWATTFDATICEYNRRATMLGKIT